MINIYELPNSLKPTSLTTVKLKFSIWQTFKHHIPRFLLTLLIDIILPLAIYFTLQKYIKTVYALLLAGTPPLLMVIFKGIWLCTFDALGFLVFITFAVSGLVAIITRNPIVLLLEKSLVTCIISIIFAITLVSFRCCRIRPLAYYLYQDLVPTTRSELGLPESIFENENEQIADHYTQLKEDSISIKLSNKQDVNQVYEWIYAHCSSFRFSCYAMTSIWAIGFFFEFLARLILILLHLPVNKIVLYGHMILSSITVLCIILSIVCITIERKYTLLYIEQWTFREQQRKSLELAADSLTIQSNSNSVLSL